MTAGMSDVEFLTHFEARIDGAGMYLWLSSDEFHRIGVLGAIHLGDRIVTFKRNKTTNNRSWKLSLLDARLCLNDMQFARAAKVAAALDS